MSRELHHFLLLTHEEQANAVKRMAALGWREQAICAATGLSVEQIRRVLTDNGQARP